MDICVIASNRCYSEFYLDSLTKTCGLGPLKIFSSELSEHNGYLDKYRDEHVIVEQDYLQMPKFVNMNLNYFRAFLYNQSNKEFLIVEDDVSFTSHWLLKLHIAKMEISNLSYLLSLYRPGIIPSDAPVVGIPYCDFSCSQGLYFHNLPIIELMTYLWKNGVERHNKPIDLILADFMSSKGLPIFATNPSLIQHEGRISNGITGFYHYSESFKK